MTTDGPTRAATELDQHTQILTVASKPCLESSWHDTSSRRDWGGAGSEPGGRLGVTDENSKVTHLWVIYELKHSLCGWGILME